MPPPAWMWQTPEHPHREDLTQSSASRCQSVYASSDPLLRTRHQRGYDKDCPSPCSIIIGYPLHIGAIHASAPSSCVTRSCCPLRPLVSSRAVFSTRTNRRRRLQLPARQRPARQFVTLPSGPVTRSASAPAWCASRSRPAKTAPGMCRCWRGAWLDRERSH